MAKSSKMTKVEKFDQTLQASFKNLLASQLLEKVSAKGGQVKASQTLYIFKEKKRKTIEEQLKIKLFSWQWDKISTQKVYHYSIGTKQGEVLLLFLDGFSEAEIKNWPDEVFDHDAKTLLKRMVGECSRTSLNRDQNVKIILDSSFAKEEVEGALIGLQLGFYSFPALVQGKSMGRLLVSSGLPAQKLNQAVKRASHQALSIDIARHLVNMPGSALNSKSYAEIVKKLFSSAKGKKWKVTVVSGEQVKKENMGLLWAVGKGAEHPPCMIHLQYRPAAVSGKKPVALVGKGITFDTGGVNIKPAQGARNMKKDMGGSASVVGTAYWTFLSEPKQPMDFYLAVAENSVSAKAFRPGDVCQARNGRTIEIDNTDAEGRLAVADVLDFATTRKGKDQPQMVIDLCTLTGAIKYGLCSEVMGLFANNDSLAKSLIESSRRSGEEAWVMPLYRKLLKGFQSRVATMTNSASGFGGAIRAALFLECFTGGVPWAHFDIYAWRDSAEGPFRAGEAHGQGVHLMCDWLENLSQ